MILLAVVQHTFFVRGFTLRLLDLSGRRSPGMAGDADLRCLNKALFVVYMNGLPLLCTYVVSGYGITTFRYLVDDVV